VGVVSGTKTGGDRRATQGICVKERHMGQYPTSTFDPNQVDFGLEKQPAWPLVIGWVSIGLAVLGLGCGACSVGALVFMPSMMPDAGELPPTMQISPMMVASVALQVVLTILLITAAVMCLRRNPTARPLYIAYAVFALLLMVFGLYVQWEQGAVMAKWAAENPKSPYAQGYKDPATAQISMISGMVIGALVGGAFPTFLLIWFGAVKTRPEQFGRRVEVVA
jgi:hypothetical protein